jgi:hypothetical protein
MTGFFLEFPMRMTPVASAVLLGLLTALSVADNASPDMATALAACHDEAVATGLEDEVAIQSYLNLCMQAWQTPDDGQASYADSPHDAAPDPVEAEPPSDELPDETR